MRVRNPHICRKTDGFSVLMCIIVVIAMLRLFFSHPHNNTSPRRRQATKKVIFRSRENYGKENEIKSCTKHIECLVGHICLRNHENKEGICSSSATYGEYCSKSKGPYCLVGDCEHGRCIARRINTSSENEVERKHPFTKYWCTNDKYSDYPDISRSCEFQNIYFFNGKWTLYLSSNNTNLKDIRLWPWSKHSEPYKFSIKFSDRDFENDISDGREYSINNGIHVYFRQPWAYNIGHAIFDGVYSAWIAMISMGRQETDRFTLIIDKPDTKDGAYQSDSIFRKFGGSNEYMKEHEMISSRKIFRFDTVLMGSGGKGQRWVTKDLRMSGSVFNGPLSFRNRIYDDFQLVPRVWTRRNRSELRAIVVQNKRYSEFEKSEIEKVIDGAKKVGLNLKYIDWSLIGNHPDNIKNHLEIVKDTDIYVSGPGTGMMYAPFLPNKAVFVGLGTWQTREDNKFVTFMEQNVLEGCSYIKAIYYPSNYRSSGIRAQVLAGLFEQALEMIEEGFHIPVPLGSNLSPEGKVFSKTCSVLPKDCQMVLEGMNDIRKPDFCVHYSWVEEVVYEIGTYAEISPGADTDCMPWAFRQEMRKQIALRRSIFHDLSQPCKIGSCKVPHVQSVLSQTSQNQSYLV